MLILFLHTWNLLVRKFCCPSLKTTKQWSRWSKREEVSQWDMFPEPTELLLIGCLVESIWTPRSKSNTLTPKTNSQTYWPSEISHVMNGLIFCVCSTSAISIPSEVLKRGQKEHKTMQVKKESQQNQSRRWIWSHDAAKGFLTCLLLLHRKARGKPNLKVRTYFWARWMSSKQEQEDLRDGCQPIKLIRMEHWRQVVFSRVEVWRNVGNKYGETRRWQVCRRWWYGLWSDTATESNFSLRSRSFLNRVNDRLRKMLNRSPEDAM